MRVYERFSYAEEFTVISTLALMDDEKFVYSEGWSSYGGGFGSEVQGFWRQTGDSITFYPEFVEKGSRTLTWEKNNERQASVRGDDLVFEDFYTLSLKR
jgi:hypothetical protein